MVLAAVMLAGILSLARLPAPGEFGPILELVVELTRPQPVVEPEPDSLPPPVTEVVEEPQPATTIPESLSESPPAEEQAAGEGAAIDWDVERDKAIKEVLDAIAREEAYSVNPRFEAARREARVRFRASLAPEVLNAWDNVEKDQLGRTVLRLGDGNCFAAFSELADLLQVLKEPSRVGVADQVGHFCGEPAGSAGSKFDAGLRHKVTDNNIHAVSFQRMRSSPVACISTA